MSESVIQKIQNCNLISLRKYACIECNHTNEWYLKCIDCIKKNTCEVGKRANDILNQETEPVKSQIDKFNERAGRMTKDIPKEPIKEKKHIGRNKVLFLFEGTEAMTPAERLEIYYQKEDPNKTINSLRVNMYDWGNRYPDLNKKYDLLNVYALIPAGKAIRKMKLGDYLKNRSKEETPMEPEEVKQDIQEADDEVSIEDFLNEQEEPEQKQDKKDVQQDMSNSQTQTKQEPASNQLNILKEFNDKKHFFREQIEKIDAYLDDIEKKRRDAEAKRADIQKKMAVLDEAAKLFGLAPAPRKQ